MKVYVTGAHACGKSTLTRYISEKYRLPMLPEAARMILSEQELQIDSLRCNLEISNKFSQQVFDRQLLQEKQFDSFVSDRTALDVLAYSAEHDQILPLLMARPDISEYINKLILPDSFIFFIRPSKTTMKQDGVRESLTWEGMLAIDSHIKFILNMYKLRFFQINTDNMQERIGLIDSILLPNNVGNI